MQEVISRFPFCNESSVNFEVSNLQKNSGIANFRKFYVTQPCYRGIHTENLTRFVVLQPNRNVPSRTWADYFGAVHTVSVIIDDSFIMKTDLLGKTMV